MNMLNPDCETIIINKGTRNGALLSSFVDYCKRYPDQRFWQALLNWSGCGYIFASGVPLYEFEHSVFSGIVKDTYEWEGRIG